LACGKAEVQALRGSSLERAVVKERREHPWASAATARRIALDHRKKKSHGRKK